MQPAVLVYLSRLLIGLGPQAANPTSRPHITQSAALQQRRWVSVGTTMILRIGDLWSDQQFVESPSYQHEEFAGVQVDRTNCRIVKAGSSEEPGRFLLPLSEHQWHLKNTHSHCVRVELGGGRLLVIPCMEIIRFYFGSSSELLAHLFTPPLSPSKLYRRHWFFRGGKKMFIELADRIPRSSAEDIARIAASPHAWRAASFVGASCLRASVAREEIYPQAIFPFEGKTDLSVSGIWLSQGETPSRTFLVYRIESCSHAFPFDALSYRLSAMQRLRSGRAPQAIPRSAGKSTAARQSRKPTLEEADASNALAPETRVARVRRRFPDLDGKPVWGAATMGGPTAGQSGPHSAAVDALAVGEPGSARRIRSTTLVEAIEAADGREAPAFVTLMQQAFAEQSSLHVEALTVTDDGFNAISLRVFADEDGVIDEAAFVRTADGHRPRLVAAFMLSALTPATRARRLVCAVVEADQISPLLYPVSDVDDSGAALESSLNLSADYFGRLTAERVPPWPSFRVAPNDPESRQVVVAWANQVLDFPWANAATVW